MDQKKTGKYIAQKRKETGLTQAQLAEKLGITDKAVSKWETARSFPDAGIVPELCNILGITANELYAGEDITNENIMTKTEENILSAVCDIQKSRREYYIYGTMYASGLGMIVMSVLVGKDLRFWWILFALNLISFAANKYSFKEKKMLDIVSVMSASALIVSVIFSADLLVNYLRALCDLHYGDGISIYSVLAKIIFGDRLWSVEGYLDVFAVSLWISVFLGAENLLLHIYRLLKK